MGAFLPDQAERLRAARVAAGFGSARAAALRHGWVYESYAQHENGTRGLGRVAQRYARAFKVSEAWLLTGTGPGPGEHSDAIARLASAYLALPSDLQAQLLQLAETYRLAAEAHRQREEGDERLGGTGER